jgi:hypothetical protein
MTADQIYDALAVASRRLAQTVPAEASLHEGRRLFLQLQESLECGQVLSCGAEVRGDSPDTHQLIRHGRLKGHGGELGVVADHGEVLLDGCPILRGEVGEKCSERTVRSVALAHAGGPGRRHHSRRCHQGA